VDDVLFLEPLAFPGLLSNHCSVALQFALRLVQGNYRFILLHAGKLTCDHFDRETDDKTSNLGLPDFQVWVLALKSAWKSHGRGHNFGRGFPCGNNTNSPNLPEMRCDSTIQKIGRWLRCVYHANYHYLHGVAFDSHSFLAKHQIGTWDHHSYPLIMSTVCYWTWP